MLIGARGAGKGATTIIEKFRGLNPWLPMYLYTLLEDIISSFTNWDFACIHTFQVLTPRKRFHCRY